MNYNESTVSGTKWTRAHRVLVENPIGEGKAISFAEEDVMVAADGTTFSKPAGHVQEPLTSENLGVEFPLRNPATGNLLATTATYAEVQVMLHSLYYFLAEKRDARLAQEELDRQAAEAEAVARRAERLAAEGQ